MLHSAVEKDDDGNVYLVWKFAGADDWMIGKKKRAWNRGIETEGDMRRLNLTEFFFCKAGCPSWWRVAADAHRERSP